MLTPELLVLAMWDRVAAPRDSSEFEPSNRLLAALPDMDLQSLQPHLEAAPLVGGSILFEVDEPLMRVYFVETGVVSLLTAIENRCTVGVATVGREGAVGVATLLLGGDTALGRFQVLVPGSALAIGVPAFRSALRQSPKLRMACEAHTRALLVQMLQAVPCNRLHTVEQRCARWLLMCADRMGDDTFELTQECLAEALGIRESTVTAIACTLQGAGLIRYRRNAITVLDRRGLEAAACECYRIVRDRCASRSTCCSGARPTRSSRRIGRMLRGGDDDSIAKLFNNTTKYVATRSTMELTWTGSVAPHDAAADVARLKREDGPALVTQGSSDLIQTLLADDLIDEINMFTLPIVLGNGKKLFDKGAKPAAFQLVDNRVTTTGVVIACYQRAGDVVTGDYAMDPPTPAEIARRERMKREG